MPEFSQDDQRIEWEEYPDLNDWLDNQYPSLKIDREEIFFSKLASQILCDLDNAQYRAALHVYNTEQIEASKELIIETYPTPVAFHFHRAEYGAENALQRLFALKDSWESLVFLLFALVVGEARFLRVPLGNAQLTTKQLFSEKLATKLEVVEKILATGESNGYKFASRSLLPEGLVEKIKNLNSERNGFVHSQTPNDAEARQLYSLYIGDVLDVLNDLKGLQDVHLLRFRGHEDSVLSLRCEKFAGNRMVRVFNTIQVTPDLLARSAIDLTDRRLVVHHQNTLYSLAPFFHLIPDGQQYNTHLCYFKKKQNNPEEEDPPPQYQFERLGYPEMLYIERTEFAREVDELRSLLQQMGKVNV